MWISGLTWKSGFRRDKGFGSVRQASQTGGLLSFSACLFTGGVELFLEGFCGWESPIRRGFDMNVHISYKISKTPDLEKIINQQVEKLGRYLQVFRPELVHLKGVVEESSAREGIVASLNLRLPSGQMSVQEKSALAATAIKAAFDGLIEQVKQHKQLLRSKHKWNRHRTADRRAAEIASFENTVALVRPDAVSPGDIASYIDVNLPRLQHFVEREIVYRESLGEL